MIKFSKRQAGIIRRKGSGNTNDPQRGTRAKEELKPQKGCLQQTLQTRFFD
jgi:hypothetical protein